MGEDYLFLVCVCAFLGSGFGIWMCKVWFYIFKNSYTDHFTFILQENVCIFTLKENKNLFT